jgi:hypothetical protein
MLSRNEPYWELGASYFDEHRRHQLVDHLARRMERLGFRVSFQLVTAAYFFYALQEGQKSKLRQNCKCPRERESPSSIAQEDRHCPYRSVRYHHILMTILVEVSHCYPMGLLRHWELCDRP